MKMESIKITKLELNDLEHIELVYKLMKIKRQLLQHDINVDVSEAFRIINVIDANTTHLKNYPEYRRAKWVAETKIKFFVP